MGRLLEFGMTAEDRNGVIISGIFFQDEFKSITLDDITNNCEQNFIVIKPGIRRNEASVGMLELTGNNIDEFKNRRFKFKGFTHDNNVIDCAVELHDLEDVLPLEHRIEEFAGKSSRHPCRAYYYLWPCYLTKQADSESSFTSHYFFEIIDACDIHIQPINNALLASCFRAFNGDKPLPLKSIAQGSAPRTVDHIKRLKKHGINLIFSLQS